MQFGRGVTILVFQGVQTHDIWGQAGLCLLQAPSGHTMELIRMRQDLLLLIADDATLAPLDVPFKAFLQIVFNRCMLRFERIIWDKTPKSVLEKIIAYEAIHQIYDLDTLKDRLIWSDRLMYAYFHPLLGDEPLIFTEVALTQGIPETVKSILAPVANRKICAPSIANTAVFYGISKSHQGLTGIKFGNLLLKQVIQTLTSEYPHIQTFVTLSPMPNFVEWTQQQISAQNNDRLSALQTTEIQYIRDILTGTDIESIIQNNADIMKKIIAKYIVFTPQGEHCNRVAHFHLGNGAELYDIRIGADANRLHESYGCMVNYRYNISTIEDNIQTYFNTHRIPISDNIWHILNT